ncbi:uncharacterized protein LOC129606475 [Condylostylus longicornis]|uniref:uncharacterized protein LOC129606475 n=1 Tax=Condylostylus longicornis TaxID=2530218 RepID=UPI00244E261F|nr:uncharacterized protein LOC129606475 [Condylostylus longicornis]
MNIGKILYLSIELYIFRIVVSDVSHLLHQGVYQHYYQPLYEIPQQIIPKPTLPPPPPPTTTTEFFFPEIIINKRAKTKNPYDYQRPTKQPPHNLYIPGSSDDFKPIDNPIQQQFPEQDQQFEIPNESFSGTLPVEQTNSSSGLNPQDYLPPFSQNGIKFKNFGNGQIFVTYDKNEFGGYDYNVPSNKPPIIAPKPIDEFDVPLDDKNPNRPDIDKIPSEGYHYEEPVSPISVSETPIPNPIDEPNLGYLPPIPSDVSIRHSKDFSEFTTNSRNPIKLQLKEMRCINSQNGFFKAVLRLDSPISLIPIVDNGVLDSRCELKLTQSHILVNIPVEDFLKCGIRNCGDNLCLRIRFPLIPEIKTASDSILTLQCKLQEKIITKIHALKMATSNNIQGRSVGAFAQGGIQQPFRTRIDILRKSSSGFTKRLEPHGSVNLGEELLLRTHVNIGDGWNYTKLTDVNLQRFSPSGEILNSVNIITQQGCINPVMRLVCPTQPSFDPPLGYRLSFKAIMFQGMRSGEEIVLSLKITGCMERADCYINTQNCNNALTRLRRSSNNNSDIIKHRNSSEIEEISKISFRVIIPDYDNDENEGPNFNNIKNIQNYQLFYLIGGSFGIFLNLSNMD